MVNDLSMFPAVKSTKMARIVIDSVLASSDAAKIVKKKTLLSKLPIKDEGCRPFSGGRGSSITLERFDFFFRTIRCTLGGIHAKLLPPSSAIWVTVYERNR